ncbi:thioesterase II family protein [Acidicapsa dinghuensis]|uniref:Thioesterase II family protein n=1 Tax=Acidicapsa dinghuensis TaxID=2218256 RepID=A0ABW1EC19_9BACT|nr:thioesterase domain-containing protein [Acidicapsa dinghuensis]
MKLPRENSTPWLQLRPTPETPQMRMFCFPHAGGGSTVYYPWNRSLPPFVQVCPIVLPGRENRVSEPSIDDFSMLLASITRHLRPWLDLPFVVFGHSMGALLAFEWVRELRRNHCPMPGWLFLSGRCAPQTPPISSPLHNKPDEEFLSELNERYRGIPDEVLSNPELLEFYLPILRADIGVIESYRYQEQEPLSIPITVFAGADDTSISWNEIMDWKLHTSARFQTQILPGGHFYPHNSLLQAMSKTLLELPLIGV